MMNSKIIAMSVVSMLASNGCARINNRAPSISADQAQAQQAPPPSQDGGQQVRTSMAAPLPEEELRADQPAPGEGAMPNQELPDVKDIQPPVCKMNGTRSEGWYRGDKLLIHAACQGVTPECQMSGTRSEGWYAGDELIEYDQCDGKLPE